MGDEIRTYASTTVSDHNQRSDEHGQATGSIRTCATTGQ
jgi:hypothetical protein